MVKNPGFPDLSQGLGQKSHGLGQKSHGLGQTWECFRVTMGLCVSERRLRELLGASSAGSASSAGVF